MSKKDCVIPLKRKENTKTVKKSKDISEVQHDNSVSMSFSMDKLSEKDVNKVIDTFDKIQKDFKKNISHYYIKTSSNVTKQKGKILNFND